MQYLKKFSLVGIALLALLALAAGPAAAQKRPNVVMLMSDDVGWGDYGVYLGGAALGHPTPNIDRLAKEGAMFTSWYGQASCTAGRASFMTGRIPIRSRRCRSSSFPATRTAWTRTRRPSPSSTRRTATRPTSPANGISATWRSSTRSITASTR